MKNVRKTSGIYDDLLDLPAALERLRETPAPESGVLTAYLNTSVEQVVGQAYILKARDGFRALREAMADADPAERKALEAAISQADTYVTHALAPRHPGLAIYASGKDDYFFVVPLPQRVAESFAWDSAPHLKPLEEALDEYERIAVALLDKQQARLFTMYLGEITPQVEFDSDLVGRHEPGDYPRRVRTAPPGGRPKAQIPYGTQGGGIAWGGMAQARRERKHYEAVRDHLREVSDALLDLLHAKPYDRLFLAGPEEATVLLEQELPTPLRARLAGSVELPINATPTEVRETVKQAAEEIERRVELELVKKLIDGATTPRVTLGLDATLEALSLGRVAHLFVTEGLRVDGSECENCGRLVVGYERCPTCGAPPTKAVELHEQMVEHALRQGARVETVAGEAAELLSRHDGVGAFTRF